LLLIEVLRLHLANAPATERGWLAGLRDPLTGRNGVLADLSSAPHYLLPL
jgi:hypothetical protein